MVEYFILPRRLIEKLTQIQINKEPSKALEITSFDGVMNNILQRKDRNQFEEENM